MFDRYLFCACAATPLTNLVALTTGSRKRAFKTMSSDSVKLQRPDGRQLSNIKSKWLSRFVILTF